MGTVKKYIKIIKLIKKSCVNPSYMMVRILRNYKFLSNIYYTHDLKSRVQCILSVV